MPGEGECQHGSLRSSRALYPSSEAAIVQYLGILGKIRSAPVVILPVRLCTLVQAGHPLRAASPHLAVG